MPVIEPPLRIFAAGSLRAVFAAGLAGAADVTFGGAGLLRERIEQGERCDLFLSADLAQPRALAARTVGAEAKSFIRNRIVVVARSDLRLRSDNLVERLLDPDLKLGTATPGSDPGGDWALELFRRADRIRPGAAAALTAKAIHLAGGRAPVQLPPGSHPVTHFLATGAADAFVCYRSMAIDLGAEFDVVMPPPEAAVIAEYGMVVLADDPRRRAVATEFADGLASPAWQARFETHGFDRLVRIGNVA